MSFVPGHTISRGDGWEHTREAKDKISAAMKLAAARRKAATASQKFYRLASAGRVHALREGLKNTMCGIKRPASLVPSTAEVNCPRCLARLPSGASV